MIIYCISGLGADERVFARLKLQAELKFIVWRKPHQQESLRAYASRLAEQIEVSQPFLLLGVSFGGIVAQELARILPAQGVMLISSASEVSALPAARRLPGLGWLLDILPKRMLFPPGSLMALLFGIKSQQDKMLFYQILADTDPDFVRWALQKLISIEQIPANYPQLQLHGTKDSVIPFPKRQQQVIAIAGGGHFMVYDRAAEISKYISLFLETISR